MKLRLTIAALFALLFTVAAAAQTRTAIIRGSVTDQSAAVIPGAQVTVTGPSGQPAIATTSSDGTFVVRGLEPGAYSIEVTFGGMEQAAPVLVNAVAGREVSAKVTMIIQSQKQEITVNDTAANQLSTESSNNASALVLREQDLAALPDDPDDLQADLQALAGPAAGPGGSQIFIDGFTGGRMPPKSSIREIRINSNPFSAEYDKLGYGRIEIFTKPGSDKFHGQAYYGNSDGAFNSRNPFLTTSPPFMTQLFGGNLSGPFTSKGSFFLDFDRRNIDDNGIVNAIVPSNDFLSPAAYKSYYSTPQRRTTVSPRLDFQLTPNNTLSLRYAFLENDMLQTGVNAFNLPATTIGGITLPSSGYSPIEQRTPVSVGGHGGHQPARIE